MKAVIVGAIFNSRAGTFGIKVMDIPADYMTPAKFVKLSAFLAGLSYLLPD